MLYVNKLFYQQRSIQQQQNLIKSFQFKNDNSPFEMNMPQVIKIQKERNRPKTKATAILFCRCLFLWQKYQILEYKRIQKMKVCSSCNTNKAFIKRPKTSKPICQGCFFSVFEQEIHETIVNNNLFRPGDRIAIGTSGGKDSTVINHVLNKLNKQYKYGVDLFMLSIDEGIAGYRDDSLQTVKRNQLVQELPLQIIGYKDLYGWTMDQIVKAIGTSNNCTYCGVFRRQALERGAVKLKCNKIVTGHNADDIAETVLLNMLRGDFVRLSGCVNPMSGEEDDPLSIPRVKPFKYTYEKEIVMYAHHKKLEYFSTECVYSPYAFRGHVRELIKQLESKRPSAILDIIRSAEHIKVEFSEDVKMPERFKCIGCGFITSQKTCKACLLLEGLNKGKPKMGIRKTK